MSSKKAEEEKQRDERIEQTGQLTLEKHGEDEKAIHMITIIGEIEGHDNLGSSSKTTKYEHILPQLAAIEDSSQIEGLLVLLNTMGGDSGRRPFHRRADCSKRGLFFYRSVRNHGDTSGAYERYGYRGSADLRLF